MSAVAVCSMSNNALIVESQYANTHLKTGLRSPKCRSSVGVVEDPDQDHVEYFRQARYRLTSLTSCRLQESLGKFRQQTNESLPRYGKTQGLLIKESAQSLHEMLAQPQCGLRSICIESLECACHLHRYRRY